MFRTRFQKQLPRRGSILLVVITFLALFAVIGLSFALYAESSNTSARTHMEAFKMNDLPGRANPDEPNAMEAVNLALGQIIYGTNDASPQVQSGFRGHDLARLMYSGQGGLSPYNGQGLFTAADGLTPETVADPIFGNVVLDRTLINNYALPGTAGVLQFDPELGYSRTPPASVMPAGFRFPKPINAPYTYPNQKDLMLAVVDTTTPGQVGRVLKPSFANPGQAYSLANDEFFSAQGRYRMLRPRPVDMLLDYLQLVANTAAAQFPTAAADRANLITYLTNTTPTVAQKNTEIARLCNQYDLFTYPMLNSDGTMTGDVQNFPYPGSIQHNDSLWMYPGGPIRKWNGKFYTAVVAPMIVDLNSRVNLSMAGNRVNGTSHGSASGLGPWEINPTYVLFHPAPSSTSDTAAMAQQRLLSGGPFPTPAHLISPQNEVPGRYGNATLNPLAANPPSNRYTGATTGQFNNNNTPPFYSRANLNGIAGARYSTVGTNFSPFPTMAGTAYPADLSALTNHPMSFDPAAFPFLNSPASPFPLRDLLTLGTRVGGKMDRYGTAASARSAPQHLLSENFTYNINNDPMQGPSPFNPLNTTLGNINPVRTTYLDHADTVRLLTTPYSSSLSRPEIVVKSINNMASFDPANPTSCRLGAIDINRPLADYRNDLKTPITPDNCGNALMAQTARQALARDVFVRLAAIVPGLIDGTTVIYVNDPSQTDYGYLRLLVDPNAPFGMGHPLQGQAPMPILRSLAQVAANIVDYVDNDDVISTFTFWPASSFGAAAPMALSFVAGTAMPDVGGPMGFPVTELGNHVVFGTELPRVIMNEGFGELANDSRDWNENTNPMGPPLSGTARPAQHNWQKRFWLELHNVDPTRLDPALPEVGRSRLYYPNGTYTSLPPGDTPVHQIVLIDMPDPAMVPGSPIDRDPTNVTGSPLHPSVVAAAPTKAIINQYNHDATYAPRHMAMNTPLEQSTIKPYMNPGNPGTSQTNDNGYFVIGPAEDFPGQDVTTATMMMGPAMGATLRVADKPMPGSVPNRMQYDAGTRNDVARGTQPAAAYLQRTANPYLAPNDPFSTTLPFNPLLPINPFITVDRIENLPVVNNVHYNDMDVVPNLPVPAMMASQGRQHVYAANQATFTAQKTVTAPSVMGATSPRTSFFTHNDDRYQPMGWLKHADRNLLNPVELAGVNAVRQSQLTQLFVTPKGMGPPDYSTNSIESLVIGGTQRGVQMASVPTLANLMQIPDGMGGFTPARGLAARLLDLFTVRSPMSGVPVGGREQGRININTMWHSSVARALFDGNVDLTNRKNFFGDVADGISDAVVPDTGGVVTPINTFWGRLAGSGITNARSVSFPNVNSADSPIVGLSGATAFNSIFRTVQDASMVTATPFNIRTPITIPGDDLGHFETVTEPLQKVWNSSTTTSEQFLVIMTVSFMEVKPNSPGITQVGGRVFLGRELFREVPGDLRTKFMAVVDRTSLGLDPVNNTLQADEKPWFTRLAADVQPGATSIQVEAVQVPGVVDTNTTPQPVPHAVVDGVARPIIDPQGTLLAGNKQFFRIGAGDVNLNQAEGEQVSIFNGLPYNAMSNPNPRAYMLAPPSPPAWTGSVCTINLPTGVSITRYHPAGSPISNVLLGNPGPQPSFDVNNARYRGVVPIYQLMPRGQ